MAPRRAPPRKRTTRRHGQRGRAKTVLICTEGKLEKRVIDELQQRFRPKGFRVKVLGERGVARTVVRAASKERKKLKQSDEVWVVFDQDGKENEWKEAIDEAREQGFKLAVSNPCF